jgi:hypothetical protein
MRTRRGGSYGPCPIARGSRALVRESRYTTYPVMVMVFPLWSRPLGVGVCSMFARMSRYHAVSAVSRRYFASVNCGYLASMLR